LQPEPKASRRVLLVGNFLSDSVGTRSVCEDLAARLQSSGWSVLETSHKSPRLARLWDMTTTVLRSRNNFDVAHVDVFSSRAFLLSKVVCWTLLRIKKPFILTLHGGNLPVFAARWEGTVRALLKSADAVTVPSGYLLKQMSPFRSDLRLIPNAIDINSYVFRIREKTQPKLIWLRAFHSVYNPLLAIKVVALLKRDHPNIELIMAGPDKGDGSLIATKQLVKDLGIEGNVQFPGKISKSEISSWLNKADIFINTTNVDNTPVSVLEAMACGLCVISTNVGGIPFLIENEIDGLLVPSNDSDCMAKAVHRILQSPRLAINLSRNARIKAALHDWSVILPRWESLLSSIS
jgi:L-malate glycosyltransferase